MIMYNPINSVPVLICRCGSEWWITGTDKCWTCGHTATPEELAEYEEAVAVDLHTKR